MAKIYTTTQNEKMKEGVVEYTAPNYNLNTITVRSDKQFHTHFGFGGAFTEATSQCYLSLDDEKKRDFINAYFSNSGLRYNLGRIPIHSCDFSHEIHTYVDENDYTLASFDMSWEDEGRIPLIKECDKVAGGLVFFSAPWSPPAYMKTNGDICHGGKLKNECRELWADYYAKALLGFKERGINVSFASVQNEPEAIQTWESREVDGTEEGIEIRDYLVPAFKKYGLDVKFLIWDHNRDRMVARAVETLSIEGVTEHVWGLGYHWYCCNKYENIATFRQMFADKHVLLSECCVETAHDSTTGLASKAGVWEHGERYGKQIINDLLNGSEGYIDWNLLLDENGGPNHVGNFCEAPIMLDGEGGIVYNPSYWYIGHFSRFIKRGAKMILCSAGRDGIYAVAYQNPDGQKVIVVMNENDRDEKCLFDIDGKYICFNVEKHSISTILQ